MGLIICLLRLLQGRRGVRFEEMKAKFWYPTVTLNVDMKKHLPAGGVEWTL